MLQTYASNGVCKDSLLLVMVTRAEMFLQSNNEQGDLLVST